MDNAERGWSLGGRGHVANGSARPDGGLQCNSMDTGFDPSTHWIRLDHFLRFTDGFSAQ